MLLNQDLLGPSESTLPQSCCPGVFWVAIVLFWCETIEISWKKHVVYRWILSRTSTGLHCWMKAPSVKVTLFWSFWIRDLFKMWRENVSIFCDYTAGVFLNQVSSDPNLGCLVYIWVYPTSLPAPKTTRNTPTTATSEATKNDRGRHLLQSLSQHFTSSSSEFTTRQVQMLQRFPWRSTQKQRFEREKGESSWRN